MLLLNGVFAWRVRTLLREGYSDFANFYCAGKIVNLGLAHDLYDEHLQYEVQQSFAPRVSIRKGPLPYIHPPFEALLFKPFARLPYFMAFLCWDFFNLAALVALPFVLRPHVPLLQRMSPWWLVLASLAFFPVCVSLIQGQDAILLLLLLTLTYVALKRNADLYAGCCLGLGLFRFHQILPVALILLLCRKVKTTLSFALTGAILGLISLAVVGWQEALAYPGFIWRVENDLERGAIARLEMPNLHGLLHVALSPYISPEVSKGLTAVLSLALIYFVSARWRSAAGRENLDLSYSLCLAASLLVSYHTYAYDLDLLFLVVVLVLNHVFLTGWKSGWRGVKLYVPVALLFFSPLQMVLWLRYDLFYLLVLLPMLWIWGISDEIAAPMPAEPVLSV
jgi:Glycosyltransferase family 87